LLNRYDATELDLSFGWKHLAGALFDPLSTSQGRRARTGELLAVAIPLNACAHAAWLSFFFLGPPFGRKTPQSTQRCPAPPPASLPTAYLRLSFLLGALPFSEPPNWCLWHQPGTTVLSRPLEGNLTEIARPDLSISAFFHHLGALPFAQLPTGAMQHLQKD